MVGTIEKTLVQTTQADGTVMSPANTGLSSVNPSSPSTALFEDDAQTLLGGVAGYRLTQSGAFQTYVKNDWAAAQPKPSVRVEFSVGAAAVNTSFHRLYSDTAQANNLGTFSVVQGSNFLQFFEQAASGTPLNQTSSVALAANTAYVLLYKIDTTTSPQTLTAQVFAKGSLTPLFTIGGNLSGSMAAPISTRTGVFTASAMPYVQLNSNFALGNGDYLARTDIVASPLTVTSAPVVTSPGSSTLTINTSGGNGKAKTHSATWYRRVLDGQGNVVSRTQLGTTPSQTSNVLTRTEADGGPNDVDWSVNQVD